MTQKNKYVPAIGIECHVQLKTATKLFAPVNNDARTAGPNEHISHICLGMPGALPVLNEAAILLACRAAYALGTKPERYSAFDRKHYFYPDLPKGYQITQQAYPIIRNGYVDIMIDGQVKRVDIERAHLEEDAGKSTHPQVGDFSLVDLNRAGTPLLEIVSAPVMNSAKEARAYVRELYLLMRYAGVSDADLYHGNMRFDVNVSISKSGELGTRTETKNLNSFRSVERAVSYEISRQTAVLEKGESVLQETRGWDEAKQRTVSQRGKEEAHDYRYFPEPDIPPVELSEAYIKKVEASIPIMPDQARKQLKQRGLTDEQIEILVEAELDESVAYIPVLVDPDVSTEQIATIANLMVQVEVPARTNDKTLKQTEEKTAEQRKVIYKSVEALQSADKLSSTNAKALLHDLLFSGASPKDINAYAEQQGYIQLSDDKALEALIDKVLADNKQAAEDVRAGETKAIGFLVGRVMQASHGKANPARVKELLNDKLS